MERLVRALTSTFGVVATLATVVMMIAITIDVFYRTLYQKSVSGILEISETALVAAVFLGMSYTGATNSHIQIDLLTERLPHKVRQVLITIAWILTSVFLVWAVYATSTRAIKSTEEGEIRMGLVNWPIYPSRWIIAIGFMAMLIVALVNVVRTFQGKEVLGFSSPEQLADAPVHPFELTEEAEAVRAREAAAASHSTTDREVDR